MVEVVQMVMTRTIQLANSSESTDDSHFSPITVEEVSKLFSKCKVGKACGPDNLCTRILKECSVELAPVFCKLFNLCLEKETLPDIWKLSAISPLPKTANPKCSNDFRPIALTSVVMKIFEQIIKSRLLSHIVLDEHQFAYKKNRSTKDACITLDHVLRSIWRQQIPMLEFYLSTFPPLLILLCQIF